MLRAAAMINRRAADSAGRKSRNMARWRWRGRVGSGVPSLEKPGLFVSLHEPLMTPAMANSVTRMRFSASRCRSIAAFQSIARSVVRARIVREGRRGWTKKSWVGCRSLEREMKTRGLGDEGGARVGLIRRFWVLPSPTRGEGRSRRRWRQSRRLRFGARPMPALSPPLRGRKRYQHLSELDPELVEGSIFAS